MLERLQQGHRYALKSLLSLTMRRPTDALVERLMESARQRSQRERRSLTIALCELHERVRERVSRRLTRAGAGDLWNARSRLSSIPSGPPRFVCDGSLGGLARWLRGAGYHAEWTTGESAPGALSQAQGRGAGVFVTTDSSILGRLGPRAGAIVTLWVPSSLRRVDQATWILRELSLPLLSPRCMACGEELVAVAKQSVADRIPPRTARWKNEYFLCRGCDRLFWQGTHWERIRAQLLKACPVC